jgi:hypothetical protein
VSEFGNDLDPLQADFARLESIVHAAGGYVHPTDDLRPNTLEAAQDACRQRRTNLRFGGLGLFVLLLAATGFPGFLLSSPLGPAFVPSSELHRRAALSVAEGSVGTNWALYEVFSELRGEQAELLHHSD